MTDARLADRLRTAITWRSDGRRVMVASLIGTDGSTPLPLGSMMLVDDRGRMDGSITGGCVEAAVVEEAVEMLAADVRAKRVSYGFSDSQAAAVGLMCGGRVEVFLAELGDVGPFEETAGCLDAGEPVALVQLLDGPHAGSHKAVGRGSSRGELGADLLDRNVLRETRGYLDKGRSGIRRYGEDGATVGDAVSVWIQSFATAPRMVIFGATDFSSALAQAAQPLGYAITIVDARPGFLDPERFGRYADTVVSWPQTYLEGVELGSRDAVLVLTHDPKFDEPAILGALDSGAGYIGALGSRRAADDRLARLRAAGADSRDLQRLRAPCGLDLGGRTPMETAVSILAEIIALGTGRLGGPLQESDEPIHPRVPVPAAG